MQILFPFLPGDHPSALKCQLRQEQSCGLHQGLAEAQSVCSWSWVFWRGRHLWQGVWHQSSSNDFCSVHQSDPSTPKALVSLRKPAQQCSWVCELPAWWQLSLAICTHRTTTRWHSVKPHHLNWLVHVTILPSC